MRKYVVGIVIGVLLASAFPVSAAVTSLVGKKITNEYTITVDGKDIGVKAIVVDGVSYTPNRAIVGAMGGDVKFLNKTVVVTTEQGGGSVETPTKSAELQEIEAKLKDLKDQTVKMSSRMKSLMVNIGGGKGDIPAQQAELDQLKIDAEALKAQIAELERQKAALEAQN